MRLRPMQSRSTIMNEPAPMRNLFAEQAEQEWAMVKESEPFA